MFLLGNNWHDNVNNYSFNQNLFPQVGVLADFMKGNKIKLGAISTIHQIIDLNQLKEESKKYNVTITQYLTAVLMY